MHGLRTDEEYDSFMKDSKGQTVRLIFLHYRYRYVHGACMKDSEGRKLRLVGLRQGADK